MKNGIEISSIDYAKINILSSPLFVYIFSGDRMVGFASPLDIFAEARDPDVFGDAI